MTEANTGNRNERLTESIKLNSLSRSLRGESTDKVDIDRITINQQGQAVQQTQSIEQTQSE